MTVMFKAKYIHVIWGDRDSALRIEESNDDIPVNIIDVNHSYIDVIAYSKINNFQAGQLAFQILDEPTDHIPSFKIDSANKVDLRPVLDNVTGKTWWVEGSKWSRKNNCWLSEIFRSPGEVELNIGLQTCVIHISTSSFTYKELELYLQDFRNDFWSLILNETNYIRAEGVSKKPNPKVLGEDSIQYLEKFIEFIINIIKNPKKELREIQLLQDYKKVRPVARTFMEISTKGHPKLLTSRGYKESYNIAENKYIHHIVSGICVLLKNIINVTSHTSKIQQKKNEGYVNRISGYSDIKTIDKEVVDNEINELQCMLDNEKLQINDALKKQDHEMSMESLHEESVIIRIRKRTKHEDELIFFGDVKRTINDDWSDFKGTKYENSFYMLSFDKDIFPGMLKDYHEYEILGYISKSNTERRDGGYTLKRDFKYINKIKIINSKIKKKLDANIVAREQLISTNWKRPLNRKEREEQSYEIQALEKAKKLSLDQQKISEVLTKKYTPLLTKTLILKKKFEKLKVQSDSYFPNSMTFIQNPNYQGAHKLYKHIMSLSGLDESLFVGLQEIEKIGILNISLIYERWCLLQIINILIDTYKFFPEEQWKHKLIDQTLSKGRNIQIKFENTNTQRQITLWYEKELNSGKRPDFVLDVRSIFRCDTDTNMRDDDNYNYRLVMDAKFHERINDIRFGGISTIINNLYNNKNYSEDNKNCVFIIHPSKSAVPTKKTPQEWATNSYYGEVRMFDWDEESPNHKYGGVLLSPIVRNGNYLDDLQRLIGMFLQYGIEDNANIKKSDKGLDPMVKEKIFCLVCGFHEYTWEEKRTKHGIKYWVICNKCHHFTVYNYCAGCKNRLIKNGDYWTYHSTQALEPTNIKCPACGDML